MIFALTQTNLGSWGWMLMLGTECLAKSAKSHPTELACRMEIERIHGDLTKLCPTPVSRPVMRDRARRSVASF